MPMPCDAGYVAPRIPISHILSQVPSIRKLEPQSNKGEENPACPSPPRARFTSQPAPRSPYRRTMSRWLTRSLGTRRHLVVASATAASRARLGAVLVCLAGVAYAVPVHRQGNVLNGQDGGYFEVCPVVASSQLAAPITC